MRHRQHCWATHALDSRSLVVLRNQLQKVELFKKRWMLSQNCCMLDGADVTNVDDRESIVELAAYWPLGF